MSHYKEIDDLVHRYQKGQESPKGSPERARGKAACDMLVMTFKPLILSTMQRMPGIGPADYEDAYQDGVVAFMEGLKKYDASSGGRFNAFIKTHLQLYYRKWQSGQFNNSVIAHKRLEDKAPGAEGLTLADTLADPEGDAADSYLKKDEARSNKTRLAKGLFLLTDSQKEVVAQHYQKGRSLREIARNQQKTHQSVAETHRLALRKLRKAFE